MQAHPASQFADVLAGALALSADDRLRLCSVLQRLAEPPAAAPMRAADVHTAELPLSADETLQQWLAQIAREPSWTQLLVLDEALEDVDSQSAASALQAARTRLLHANPAIAVRLAVVALASRHPFGVCVGLAGLGVALFGLARGLLRIVL